MDFNTEAAMKKAMEVQKAQANAYPMGGALGLGGQHYQDAVHGIPAPPVFDTVGSIMGLLVQQASELRDRTSALADQIAGPVPTASTNSVAERSTCSLVDLLNALSRTLTDALSATERAQRSL